MNAQPGSRMRLLAPAALIVFAVLLLAVVTGSVVGGSGPSGGGDAEQAGAEREAGSERPRARGRATYKVRAGDTLGSIAERTGRTPEQLQELNPGLDAQTLQPGQKLKLRE
ncbi:MAG: LysM peptidoglycan-binding domain-containing protein [Thermoleophilaceae bacterium]|jgi:LysM repeat protein|nr:LysM peptidoglycan-binding domain-containing protein [Thermoleophilaceae bacterium]